MWNLVIRDTRVEGFKPRGDDVLEVDANTPLSGPVAWAADKAAQHGAGRLKLMAHGEPGAMQFCHELLTINTVDAFAPLHGRSGASSCTPALWRIRVKDLGMEPPPETATSSASNWLG